MSFLTLRDSTVLALEPPGGISVAGDAFSLQEGDVIDSTIRYFGDVTGNFGNTYGLTQNGSRAVRTQFVVEEPSIHIPDYVYHPNGDSYTFSWLGNFPGSFGNVATGWQHLQDCDVEYIRDVELGSVNVSSCSFSPWLSEASPVFSADARSQSNPPAVELYDMDQSDAPNFGCNISDSNLTYIWDVEILKGACQRCNFWWGAQGKNVQPSWTKEPPTNPSFWVDLDTYDNKSGFVRAINDTLACMRPSLRVNGTSVKAQALTIDNASFLFNSHFVSITDPQCVHMP